MIVYLVKETGDIETYVDHGVFSTPELATAYVNLTTRGTARWTKDGQTAEAPYARWDIIPHTVDEPCDPYGR